jgi:hypothetical protein
MMMNKTDSMGVLLDVAQKYLDWVLESDPGSVVDGVSRDERAAQIDEAIGVYTGEYELRRGEF